MKTVEPVEYLKYFERKCQEKENGQLSTMDTVIDNIFNKEDKLRKRIREEEDKFSSFEYHQK